MKKLITLIGTRPEIIKMSALLPLLDQEFDHILVHSGQHYSPSMDRIFFEELRLKEPDICLKVNIKLPGKQLGIMIAKFEKILIEELPDAVIVQGDTNTTLAGALAVAKHRDKKIKLIHVEAGARSFNNYQAEEINRKLVDQVSDLLLVANRNELKNITREGLDIKKAVVTGNTVIESCLRMADIVDQEGILYKYGVQKGKYIVVTFHRQETVDDRGKLDEICRAIRKISEGYIVVLPLHPRTKTMINRFGINLSGSKLRITGPIGYGDMIGLIKNCRFCLTDSGGLQEEAAVLQTPTLILRNETEHVKYVKAGINKIVSTKYHNILKQANQLINDDKEYIKRKSVKVKIIKNVGLIIIKAIHELLREGK